MKRYSSGLIFLDYCIENSIFAEAIEKVKMKDEEDKMWQLYLSTQPYTDMTFEEWKNKTYKEQKTILKPIHIQIIPLGR